MHGKIVDNRERMKEGLESSMIMITRRIVTGLVTKNCCLFIDYQVVKR